MRSEDETMKVAFYGDDFTGSIDTLLQFRLAGLRGVLVTEVGALSDIDLGDLSDTDLGDADVVGIAGVARSLPTAAMPAEVVPALRELQTLNPQVVQYKACSTADSSATVGSLGRVLEIAREEMPYGPIPICFAQPDFGRYTFFGHHFARDGEQVYRLDRQPTMQSHPVTPATESDLGQMLAAQTALPLANLSWLRYQDPADLAAELCRDDVAAVICDAFTDGQLDQLAAALLADLRRPRFVLGSGGISAALGRMINSDERLPPLPVDAHAADVPVLVLSGSMSGRTAAQVELAASHGWTVLDLFDPRTAHLAAARHAQGENVIITSALGRRTTEVGDGVGDALAEIGGSWLRRQPDTRLILCGGDTSGQVLRRLGVRALTVQAAPWGNVALCQAHRASDQRLDVVLKGGQMGHPNLFEDVRQGRPSPPGAGQLTRDQAHKRTEQAR